MSQTEELKAERTYLTMVKSINGELDQMKPKMNAYVVYRLASFVAAVAVWFFYDHLQNWTIGVCLLLLFAFLILVKRNNQLKEQRQFLQAKLKLAKAELAVIKGDYSQLPTGDEFMDKDHAFVLDLDIFGQGSLFQYLNRSQTDFGRRTLANWLKYPLTREELIRERQMAVEELSGLTNFRLELYASGSPIEESPSIVEHFLTWMKSTRTGIAKDKGWLFYLVPLYSISTILAYSFDLIGFFTLLMAYFAPLLIIAAYLKRINAVYNDLGRYHRTLGNYSLAFEIIEKEGFADEHLRSLATDAQGAGKALGRLSGIISAFDNRNNILLALFLNASFLWDLRCVRNLEEWKIENEKGAERWFLCLANIESLGSLATFRFNRQEETIMPEITTNTIISAEALVHPLMIGELAVSNDFKTSAFGQFSIITGANMAGKSTFLRTLGVNLLLAMIGSAVVAEAFTFRPVQLFTSMRTSDSLQKSESYFYSELKRLQMIVERLDAGEKLFIILDEILKGTNSTDKAEGSKKFMEKLLGYKAAGVIATHDLSLCTIEEDFPDHITNLYFDVEVKKDDLYFDYTLRKGVCSNMNATFLMKKMGITQ